MNFKINNYNFKGSYKIGANLDKISAQVQEFFQTPHAKAYIRQLPDDTFVKINSDTTIASLNNKIKENYLTFETSFINEQINLRRMFGDSKATLKVTQNKKGQLEEKPILDWFDKLMLFYINQK